MGIVHQYIQNNKMEQQLWAPRSYLTSHNAFSVIGYEKSKATRLDLISYDSYIISELITQYSLIKIGAITYSMTVLSHKI